MSIGVGVSCRFSYSIVSYLYVSCSGLVTSTVGEERANFSAIMWFLLGGFPLPLRAWDGLRCFIVPLSRHYISFLNCSIFSLAFIVSYKGVTDKD